MRVTEPSLDRLAQEFADDMTSLLRGVLGEDTPQFHAVNIDPGRKIRLQPMGDDNVARPIPIKISGEVRMGLLVTFDCCWDGSSTFLATDESEVHVFYADATDPLFRFEYVRSGEDPPGAHIHVHAHRDEVAYLLRLADTGRPKAGLRKNRLPRLAEIHLPVGGHRMRPALEDVLLFLKREFAIETVPGWQKAIEDHVRKWPDTQLRSAVRDSPEAAAEVLRALKYRVEPPAVPPQRGGTTPKLYLP